MSVVGIDVGNDTSCVSLARNRGVDTLMNQESKRETPAVVNFGDKMRFIGVQGMAKMPLAPQNTVHQLKRIIGRKFSDPNVQSDMKKLPFSITEGPDGGCLINVQYCNESCSFTPEQVMAMILVDLKKIVEADAGIHVSDCVLAVPTYFNEAGRAAMIDAATIAGLKCLRLINETTATALAYSIYKTDLPETEAVNVAFVDVGHSSTQVSIISLKKGGMQIRSHAWDQNLGGRDVDETLFDHFCAEFKAKNKIDIASNKKASFKLRVAIEKLKKVLSANADSPLNVECIMDDVDVRSKLSREELEQICAPLFARIKGPCDEALVSAGLKAEDISSVEIVGSSTRIPAIAKVIEDVFKKHPSRTLNSKECVSRGCALQCAMLSPVFKVREFGVEDACPYSVEFRWEKEDGSLASQILFDKNSSFPATKMLTFMRKDPFKVSSFVLETDTKVGEYEVGPFEVPPGAEKAKIKVKARMNLHGLVSIEGVDSFVDADGDVKMEEAEADKKKLVKKTDVPFHVSLSAGFAPKRREEYFEKEGQLQAADRLQEETNEKKNALEGYIYSLRNRMHDALAPFIKEADKENLSSTLQAAEDWLYDEGDDVTKSVYITKLEELKKVGGPIEMRYFEDQTRGPAAESLRSTANSYMAIASNTSAQYAHLEQGERDSMIAEASAALKWLSEKEAMQAKIAKTDEPCFLTSEVTKKRDTVERVCKPIATKPKPKPPAPAPAAAPSDPTPMESDGQEPGESVPMESEEKEAQDTAASESMEQ